MVVPAWRLPEDEARRVRLLVHLSNDARDGGIASVSEFYMGDEALAEQARVDVFTLVDLGMVEPVMDGGGSLDGINAVVHGAAHSRAALYKQMWAERGQRRWAAREALLTWLYDQGAESAAGAMSWERIFTSTFGFFHGDPFTLVELDEAAGWLERKGLIGGPRVEERVGPVLAHLTDEGLTCAEDFQGDVAIYDARRNSTAPVAPSITVSGHNVQYASGDRSSQVINVGMTPEQIVLTIQGLGELLRKIGLGLDDEDLAAAEQEALADLASEHPTGKPARRFLKRFGKVAEGAATPALAQGLIAAGNALEPYIEHAIHALG